MSPGCTSVVKSMSPPKMSASASVRSIVSPCASSAATSEECWRSIVPLTTSTLRVFGIGSTLRHQRIVRRSADAEEAVAVDLVLEAADGAGVGGLETVRLVGAHLSQIEHRCGLTDDRRDVLDRDVCARSSDASVAPARTRDDTMCVSSDSRMSPFAAAMVSVRATLALVRVSHAEAATAAPMISKQNGAHG